MAPRPKSARDDERDIVLEQLRQAGAVATEAAKTALQAARVHENAVAILNGTVETAHVANRAFHGSIETLINEKLLLAKQLGDALKANQEIEVRLHAQELATQERTLAAKKQIELLATIRQLGGQALTMYQTSQLPPGTTDKIVERLHEIVPRISGETMGMLVADVGKDNVEALLRLTYNQPAN